MQATKQHPLASIAQSGAQPMKKVAALRTGNPDKTTGMVWAQTAIALCIGQASEWTNLAHGLFAMNIEQRDGALAAWKAWKSEKTKAFKSGEEQSPKMDEKDFKRIMATATVRLSHMSTIAKAITAGMDVEALAHHYKIQPQDVSGLSIDSLYNVAKLYSGSKAGRPAQAFLEKLSNWMVKNGPDSDSPEIGDYNTIMELVNKLAAAKAAVL